MKSQQEWAKDDYCKNEIIHHRVKEVIVKQQTVFQKVEIYGLVRLWRKLIYRRYPAEFNER